MFIEFKFTFAIKFILPQDYCYTKCLKNELYEYSGTLKLKNTTLFECVLQETLVKFQK